MVLLINRKLMAIKIIHLTAFLFLFFFASVIAQEKHHYQTNFSKEEFAERRSKIFEAIGTSGIALIQGSSGLPGFSVFRQNNTFYYLTGLESPHAYILLNGKSRQATIYITT